MQQVKKEIILVIVGFLLAVSFAVSTWAVPGLINYQGKLLENGGILLNKELFNNVTYHR
ncbi:MAG: hypothetical protein J7J70_00040 [Deltaproteobacteria bacterium]|nr:hypothetical protein [Candidatus Tharpellaceae bacterium]